MDLLCLGSGVFIPKGQPAYLILTDFSPGFPGLMCIHPRGVVGSGEGPCTWSHSSSRGKVSGGQVVVLLATELSSNQSKLRFPESAFLSLITYTLVFGALLPSKLGDRPVIFLLPLTGTQSERTQRL